MAYFLQDLDCNISFFDSFRAVVGELDEDLDKRLDFEKMKAPPLAPIWIQS